MRAIIAQRHSWRGVSFDRDLWDCIFVLGFVTIWVSRRALVDLFHDKFGGAK